jgi:hypothetical protein
MIRAFADCTLTGDNFSPKALLEKLAYVSFYDANEVGDVDPKTGRIWKYGGAILCYAPNLGRQGDKIEWDDMLDFFVTNQQIIRDCGVDNINLTLNFFYQGDGASWHVKDKDIKTLANLGIGLSIDWYQIDDPAAYPAHMQEDSFEDVGDEDEAE